MRKSLVAGLAVASTIGFFTPLTSQAFGLGQIELKSALNQPFRAEIEVTSLPANERDLLEVNLASRDEFIKAGLDKPVLYSGFKFEIIEQNGQTKIRVTSKAPVKEPFLDFLLVATTGQGQMLREYTVLLDPPEYVMVEVSPEPAKPAVKAETVAVQVEPAKTVRTTSYDYTKTQTVYQAKQYGPVKRNDTLWQIALDTRPNRDISVHQMMLALVDANPSAFQKQNINGLKAGATLHIPESARIRSRSRTEAVSEVKVQNLAWANRNNAPSTTPEQTSIALTQVEQTVTAEQPQMQTDDIADTISSPVDNAGAQLELVAPEALETSNEDASTLAMGSSDVETLTEQLSLAEEAIEAKTQENIDFQAKIEDLELQVETMRRMLSVQDSQLAQLQKLLGDDGSTAGLLKQQVEIDNTPATESTSAQAQDSSDALMIKNEVPAATQESTEQADSTEETVDLFEKAQTQFKLQFDNVKQFINTYKIEAAASLLALLLLLLVFYRRRNHEVTWEEAVEESKQHATAEMTNAPLQTQSEMLEPTTQIVDMDTPTVRTVEELLDQADMFVGYADYVQAKSALEQAIAQQPDNLSALHKLFFVLYKQDRPDAFFNLFEDKQQNFAENSNELLEIKRWGNVLFPDTNLFQVEVEDDANVASETEEPLQTSVIADEITRSDDIDAPEIEEHIEFNLEDFTNDTSDSDESEIEAPSDSDEILLNFNLDEELEPTSEDALTTEALDLSENTEETPENTAESNTEQDEDSSLDESLLAFDIEQDNDADQESELATNVDTNNEALEAFDIDLGEEAEDVVDIAADVDSDDDSLKAFDISSSDSSLDDFEFEIPTESSGANMDLGYLDEIDEIDEAETKLDLAAAYIDMDDPDGAKNILNEVLTEGSDEQKTRAQALLNALN